MYTRPANAHKHQVNSITTKQNNNKCTLIISDDLVLHIKNQVQSNLDISNSDISNFAKLEASI